MEPTIQTRDTKLTERLRDHVDKKTSRLERYLPNIASLHVDLTEQNARNPAQRQIAQITLRDSNGTILRAEERAPDMFAAVDLVVDKMYSQIKRYRDKRNRRKRASKGNMMVMEEPLPLEIEDDIVDLEPVVMRRKSFPVQMMTPDEAIDQMDLLGHDFYMFLNDEDDQMSVVYRRHDSSYGLLQPELG